VAVAVLEEQACQRQALARWPKVGLAKPLKDLAVRMLAAHAGEYMI
jgi:hypothetical protein